MLFDRLAGMRHCILGGCFDEKRKVRKRRKFFRPLVSVRCSTSRPGRKAGGQTTCKCENLVDVRISVVGDEVLSEE